MEIVSACLARDLPVYRWTAESLRRHIPDSSISVITRREDFPKFHDQCGKEVRLIDEREVLDHMTLEQLRSMPQPFFPKGAGWYYQQFIKLGFHCLCPEDEHYLIWDADTVLLREMEFMDDVGRGLYVPADEHHQPYFDTFERLFGQKANREYSFISQHQLIHTKVLRTMLSEIESRFPDCKSWEWAVMESLRGDDSNQFSEYETYGHYLKMRNPDLLKIQNEPWARNGTTMVGYPPTANQLKALSEKFAFVAFEANARRSKRIFKKLKAWLGL